MRSFTARRQLVDDVPTKAVVLKLLGGPETRLSVTQQGTQPLSLTQPLQQLAESGG